MEHRPRIRASDLAAILLLGGSAFFWPAAVTGLCILALTRPKLGLAIGACLDAAYGVPPQLPFVPAPLTILILCIIALFHLGKYFARVGDRRLRIDL